MRRQGTDRRRSLPLIRLNFADIGKLSFAFQLLKGEFELFDLEGQLLRRLTKGEPPELPPARRYGRPYRRGNILDPTPWNNIKTAPPMPEKPAETLTF